MEGILSKGITFKAGSLVVEGLQSIPSLGGTPNKVDITTLDDASYHYMNGLKDYGDLDFTFLLSDDMSNFKTVRTLEEAGSAVACEVALPNGTKFKFNAELAASIEGASVDAALTFTVRAGLTSDITVEYPA